MPVAAVSRYNKIDMGIYLCILEVCMAEKGLTWTRQLFIDSADEDDTYTKVAEYQINLE